MLSQDYNQTLTPLISPLQVVHLFNERKFWQSLTTPPLKLKKERKKQELAYIVVNAQHLNFTLFV